jgi:hypothetical protein
MLFVATSGSMWHLAAAPSRCDVGSLHRMLGGDVAVMSCSCGGGAMPLLLVAVK